MDEVSETIDRRTMRPVGDHGTANDALEWALDVYRNDPSGDGDIEPFLRAWREGDAMGEWPEFYEWLKVEGR
jgi:hypothetical protein